MKNSSLTDIAEAIKKSNVINISFHESPDGDAIGSSLALFKGLLKLNKKVDIICKEEVPNYLKFLPNSQIINGKNNKLKENLDCLIIIDCGDVKRINIEKLKLPNEDILVINMDHHLSNEFFGDLNHVNSEAAAISEIIYDLLNILNIEIDKEMAECLYTALITDTGSFKFSNTTFKTHNIAGELINKGINFTEIHRTIFENKPFKKIKFFGKVIDSMKLKCENKICIIKITNDMLESCGIDESDTSDVITFGNQVDSSEVTLLLKESKKDVKVSLRSKNYVDVRKIAEKFNGGGHAKAAGLKLSNVSIEEAEKVLINAIENELIL